MKISFTASCLLAILTPSFGQNLRTRQRGLENTGTLNFCKAYDGALSVPDPSWDTTGFEAQGNVELMTTVAALGYAAEFLSLVPGIGTFASVASVGLSAYNAQIAPDVVSELLNYVDKVNADNTISDIETEWNLKLNVIQDALANGNYDLGADQCSIYFGGSTTTWGGELTFEESDYSLFDATKRLAYAPAFCNACVNIHSLRVADYGQSYDSLIDTASQALAADAKEGLDDALTDLRYVAGRCLLDVLPMAWDAVWKEHALAVDEEINQKDVDGGLTTRYYSYFDWDGSRYFEYDFGCYFNCNDSTDYAEAYGPYCARDMKKRLADFWFEWYQERLFLFQRSWSYLLSAVNPNGLVLTEKPKDIFADRNYIIMNEALGGFLYVGNVRLQDQDATTGPDTDKVKKYGACIGTSGSNQFNFRAAETTGLYEIVDVNSDKIMCAGTVGEPVWFNDDYIGFCEWNITQAAPEEDPSAFIFINEDTGTYLSAAESFLDFYYEHMGVETTAVGSENPSAIASRGTWRIFQTPDFDTLNYASIYECDESSDCDEGEICDPFAKYCRTAPELDIGEKCLADDQCSSGVCQEMTVSHNRCAKGTSAGGILSVCDDVSTCGASSTSLTCVQDAGANWGLCKQDDYEKYCQSDDWCVSGVCRTDLSVPQCDAYEAGAYLSLCDDDTNCSDGYACNSDGRCDYEDGYILVYARNGNIPKGHQALAEACGGSLVSIRNAGENAAVQALLTKYGAEASGAFIGLFSQAGPWTWLDGSEYGDYTNWFDSYSSTTSSTKWYGAKTFFYGDNKENMAWTKVLASQNNGAIYRLPADYTNVEGCDYEDFDV